MPHTYGVRISGNTVEFKMHCQSQVKDTFRQQVAWWPHRWRDHFLERTVYSNPVLDLSHIYLTHWGRDKMAAISQTTLSNAFSWMKMLEFRLQFHWIMFLGSNWQYSRIGSDNGLAPIRRQAIIWTNDDPVQRRIYASLGLNGLMWKTKDIRQT